MQRGENLQCKHLWKHTCDYLRVNGPILLILLLSTAAFIYINQSYPLYRGNDERDYALEVLELRDHAWLFWNRKFGYLVAVACISSMLTGGNIFKAANVVAISSSVLFLWATYVIFKNLFGRKIALLTTLATLTSSVFFVLGMASMTDMPFACLSTLSVCFLMRQEAPKAKEAILAGVLGGLAAITRDNGIVLFLFIPLWLLLNPYRLNRKRRVRLAIAYLIPYFVIQIQWVWIPVVSLTQENVVLADFFALPPTSSTPRALARSAGMAQSAMTSLPDFNLKFVTQFILRLLKMNALLWQPIPLTTSLFLVILGTLLWLRERKQRPQVVFLLYLLLHIGVISVQEATGHPRLLMPVLPMLCFFALFPFISNTLVPDFDFRLPVLRSKASLKVILLVLLLAWGAYRATMTAKADYQEWSQTTAYKFDIMRWLREQPPSEGKAVTVMLSSSLEFLLGDYGIDYRGANVFDDVWEYPEGAWYLIFEKPEMYYDHGIPGFKRLEFPLDVPANLEPVWLDFPAPHGDDVQGDNVWAAVYQVWEEAHYVEVAEARASSFLLEPPRYVIDHRLGTDWTSQKHATPSNIEWIGFDLGEQKTVNHVWLLPNEGGASFPRDFQIQVSADGEEWTAVVEEHDYPRPESAQPQLFAFDAVECRFLTIVAGELGEYAAGENEYAMGFREVVLKHAYQEAPLPALSISRTDVSYEPETGLISTQVWNEGATPITATVRFYNEYPLEHLQTRTYVAAISLAIPPGESVDTHIGAVWPSGLYTVTVKVTEEGNVRSQQACKAIDIISSSAVTDTRAILLPQQAVHYRFGDKLALIGYTVGPEHQMDEHITFTLYWRALASMGKDYTVSVDLVDEEGSAQFGGDFMLTYDGDRPTSQWEQWETIASETSMYLPTHLQPGTYQLRVGLYSADTMERLRVFDADNKEWSGDAATLQTRVTVR